MQNIVTDKLRGFRVSENHSGRAGGAAASAGILFEQRLGAFFAISILCAEELDQRFGLGTARGSWLRFETEAPVDDLLVATTAGGYIAIQAKTTASLSKDPASPFGRTIDQFVRHWHACAQGDGSLGWNRPLDPERDRLVLAVGPAASETIKTTLPSALRQYRQREPAPMSKAQLEAIEVFGACVKSSWQAITSKDFDPEVLTWLASLIDVFVFDSEGVDASLSITRLRGVVTSSSDASSTLGALTEICGTLMTQRGGHDESGFRARLFALGVDLRERPLYRTDIELLQRHSKEIAETLSRYESLEIYGEPSLTVERDCQADIDLAAREGDLLVVGEPGSGKSGVLSALARRLAAAGEDVVELAVDRYSVETLEGLARELKLRHPVLDVLEAWDGPRQGWLIIDALDATRGGRGEGVFRGLIQRVMHRSGRWRVIASIRSFDLRMGHQLREAFGGSPPVRSLADPAFSAVRHVTVPRWTDDEFNQLLSLIPLLQQAMYSAPPKLRDIAKTPFNTKLICEILSRKGPLSLLSISSQVDLLNLYWEHRVVAHGLEAEHSVERVVNAMVDSRSLKSPVFPDGGDPKSIEQLCREGVLTRVDGGRWLQFRHHLLFDFAAARSLISPERLIAGTMSFPKLEAKGLLLSPALSFVLREVWDRDVTRTDFWLSLKHLICAEDTDPVIRSVAARLGAEYPQVDGDTAWFKSPLQLPDKAVAQLVEHIIGSLAVRIEDDKEVAYDPWVGLAKQLASRVDRSSDSLRFLLHLLLRVAKLADRYPDLGDASRALLRFGLTTPSLAGVVVPAITFVAETYATDKSESSLLLSKLLESSRVQAYGAEEIPALCYSLKSFGEVDPAFVATIYSAVYSQEITEDRETALGSSRILPLRSNARQDFDMARYSLGEYFGGFIAKHPQHAVDALVSALSGYVQREHSSAGARQFRTTIGGLDVRLWEDRSHIWASDPDGKYSSDGVVLVDKLLGYLREASSDKAEEVSSLLIERSSWALVWARLFLVACERKGVLVDKLWPIAASEPFLMCGDTVKDAIDLVALGIPSRTLEEREAFESALFRFDFSHYADPATALTSLVNRVLSTIGSENLLTVQARTWLTDSNRPPRENARLFRSTVHWGGAPEPYFWLEGLDKALPANASLIAAIDLAKTEVEMQFAQKLRSGADIAAVLGLLEAVRNKSMAHDLDPRLRPSADGQIGSGCSAIAQNVQLGALGGADTSVDRLLDLLHYVATSPFPEVDDDTESDFEKSPGWGSPAARVEAAQAMSAMFWQRPDLFDALRKDFESLLRDAHPAVRLQLAAGIANIWSFSKDAVWAYFADRLSLEKNLAVVEHVASGVLPRLVQDDPDRSFELISQLLDREQCDAERARRVRKILSPHLAIFFIRSPTSAARDLLRQWAAEPAKYSSELRRVLSVMGDSLANSKDAEVRTSVFEFLRDVVTSANARLKAVLERDQPTPGEIEESTACFRLVETVLHQVADASGLKASVKTSLTSTSDGPLRPVSVVDVAPILGLIGAYASPSTTYSLLQLYEVIIPLDPPLVFDLMAQALKGGERFGYQHESMGLDLFVRLIGLFLADYKSLFETSDKRNALIDCLEIFMSAGWPAARRLLYRLPELMQ